MEVVGDQRACLCLLTSGVNTEMPIKLETDMREIFKNKQKQISKGFKVSLRNTASTCNVSTEGAPKRTIMSRNHMHTHKTLTLLPGIQPLAARAQILP